MKEQIKKFLNEEQDPKAIEKITSKLDDLLMKNEEIGYIAVQKKPAITVLPDSIVMTNKRIIICQPKNLGLSMNFIDYTWDEIEGTFVKENILGSEFSFSTKTNMEVSIDYIPKIQARKIFTYAKEQLDILKSGSIVNATVIDEIPEVAIEAELEFVEEMETEEVVDFAEIMTVSPPDFNRESQSNFDTPEISKERLLSELSQDELFEKLQNYKKLLDNGLILQGEYDAYKKEILGYM
ncbi:PH domain-containing protein [Flavobacterium granuli]|uniref:PH (Pleckstrin Homology) domain-containing protein n=1 Tax=Flavobacterium granuli TaxID=280093 RepID=A0A1M5TH54_9FLAO|nr:PH domain-containing protein [Flavobacterium granuli]PRZ20361.1 PH (Pleckstrin Homology) domain-containing protein [Flavobacterium granuli]SHH49683.1 PH domain-containing protein [Flavobacterium granuli]